MPPPSIARVFSVTLLITCHLLAQGGCSRRQESNDAAVANPNDVAAIFVDVTDESGLTFEHAVDAPGRYFFPEIVGSGCAVVDYDSDGDLDCYLINLGGKSQAVNRFYEQVAPGVFADVTEQTGLGDTSLGMGVAVGDVNNDGWPDLYVSNYGADRLYLNQRDKTFRDITRAASIENSAWGLSACFFDFDRDGWLDLYVTNYVDYNERPCTRPGGGDQDYCSPREFPPLADKLFRNETGDLLAGELGNAGNHVRFRDVSLVSNIASQRGPGMGVVAMDLNGDHWQDVYVANDQAANFAWINQGDGRFEEESLQRGCAYDALGRAQASMGIAVGDTDGDTRFELFLTHLETEQNTLYRPTETGLFEDASIAAGMGQVSLPYTGFGTAFADLDHDGDLDVAIANGGVRRSSILPQTDSTEQDFWNGYAQQNLLLLNEGGKFSRDAVRTDAFVEHVGVSRGLAAADFDNDGDMDLLVSNIGAAARLYRNDAPKRGDWLLVRAVDPRRGGRDDYGAQVTVVRGDSRQARLIQPAGSYLTSVDPRAHFGLGPTGTYDRIEVTWSDGVSENFAGGKTNRILVLQRGQGLDDD